MPKKVELYDLGLKPYREIWSLQKKLQNELIVQKKALREGHTIEDSHCDKLLFVEHPHVYTLGKSGNSVHLLKSIEELSGLNAEYIEIDRGGDITYHGPGQIVGYPILDLDKYFTDIHKYLRYLEEVIIRTAADFDIEADRFEGMTGVWVGDQKICAMGIRCSRWVTMHGFALNVNTDLSYFAHIVPCGIQNRSVSSLSQLSGTEIDVNNVKSKLIKHFSDVFDVEVLSLTGIPEPG